MTNCNKINLMKNFWSILFTLGLAITNVFSQGTTCATAKPFCGSTTQTFPSSGTAAPSGPNYGCMQQQPNSVWYYMEASTPGTIGITMGGSSLDIDFAMWGPFSDQASGCSSVMGGVAPIQSSWSSSTTENIGLGMSGGSNSICASGHSGQGATTPPAAQTGQVYIVLISNYSNSSGTITFNQTSGTGSTNCAIVNQCSITNLTANAVCNAGNTTISGSFTVSTTDNTGTLTVTSSCGGSQTFNPPFPSTATAMNYSFNGGAADGSQCTITVSFSADPSCNATTTVTKPTASVAPTISTTPAGCTGSGGSTITNYDATATYTFSPTGPTIGAGGVISGAVTGTTYTVSVAGVCGNASNTFTINNTQTTLSAPAINTTAATCLAEGESTVTNYDNTYTYTITPAGPTVGAGGVITGAVAGTTYTIMATLGTCTSPSSTFTNGVQLPPVGAPVFTNPGPVCSGTPLSLPTVSTNGITGAWSPAIDNQTTTTYTFASDPGQCASDTTMTVVVKQSPIITADPMNQTICSGEWINVHVTADSAGVLYGWTAVPSDSVTGAKNGTGNYIRDTLFYSGTTSGTVTYAIIGSKNGCNSQPVYVTVTVNPAPSTSSTITVTASDVVVEEGNSTNLNVTMSPYISGVLYSWTPPSTVNCTDCPSPVATPTGDTWYTVKLTTPQGCNMTDSIFIKYKIKCGEIYIPNVFSPNQDGFNDIFKVHSRCMNGVQLTIYDRWGAKIFYTDDVTHWWDGTRDGSPMNTGVYVYRAVVTLIDGTKEELKGNVSLVR